MCDGRRRGDPGGSSYGNLHGETLKFATEVKRKYGPCKAVCESTGNHWIRMADAFEEAGIQLILANTHQTRVIAFAKVKKDPVDARMLAHLLRSNLVVPCHIGDAESRGDKQMLRYAIRLVQDRARVMNFVHTLTDKCDFDHGEAKCGARRPWRIVRGQT